MTQSPDSPSARLTSSGRQNFIRDVTEGEWAGWAASANDPFNETAGPFYVRAQDDGSVLCAMRVETRHLNGGGMMHGGAFMTFADFCMFAFASGLGDDDSVTLSFNCEFLKGVPVGATIYGTGEVVRRTRRMVFVRGLMRVDDKPVFSFSGVLTKLPTAAA